MGIWSVWDDFDYCILVGSWILLKLIRVEREFVGSLTESLHSCSEGCSIFCSIEIWMWKNCWTGLKWLNKPVIAIKIFSLLFLAVIQTISGVLTIQLRDQIDLKAKKVANSKNVRVFSFLRIDDVVHDFSNFEIFSSLQQNVFDKNDFCLIYGLRNTIHFSFSLRFWVYFYFYYSFLL